MPYSQIATDRNIGIDYAAMRNYRLSRVREMMDRCGIGVLVTWDAWNMRYINAGYPTVPCRWAARGNTPMPSNKLPKVSTPPMLNAPQRRSWRCCPS